MYETNQKEAKGSPQIKLKKIYLPSFLSLLFFLLHFF